MPAGPCDGPEPVIKTVHLTNAWHEQSGGIRTFYEALIAAAAIAHRPIRLIVPAETSSVEDVHEYARIYRVAAPRSPFIDRRYRLILPHQVLFGVGEVWRILREEQPDLVEVCDKYLLIYLGGVIRGGLLGRDPRPAVTALSCERMDDNVATFLSRSAMARRSSDWYMRHVYGPQFDAHIAISAYTAAEVAAVPSPVHLARMGIDAGTFGSGGASVETRQTLYGQLIGDPDAVILLYAGRLSAEKNLPLLIDMLERLSESDSHRFHLAVLGDGPLRNWLSLEAARRTPGRLHFVGHVSDRRALTAYYANADVFVHPNPREPFGIAPLEAMAAGVPLVAPAAGGVLEYVTSENAWLASPTPAAFADAVRDVMANPVGRRLRVARARETAASFDWPAVTARFFQIYDTIHAESARSRRLSRRSPATRTAGDRYDAAQDPFL